MGKVKDIDHGFKNIKEQLKKIKGPHVAVGVLSDAGEYATREGKTANLAEVATWNEYGVPGRIPSRPFMSFSFDNNLELLGKKKAELIGEIYDSKKTSEAALAELGVFFVGVVQKVIGEDHFQENAQSTRDAKDSSHPLIDTGRLRQSIHYEVRRKGNG